LVDANHAARHGDVADRPRCPTDGGAPRYLELHSIISIAGARMTIPVPVVNGEVVMLPPLTHPVPVLMPLPLGMFPTVETTRGGGEKHLAFLVLNMSKKCVGSGRGPINLDSRDF